MLKKLVLLIFILRFVPIAQSQEIKKKLPEITFKTKLHNFDTIEFEKPVTYYFEFKNTGNSDLIIKNIFTDCHCTTFEWSRLPLKKRKKSRIKVTFNAGTRGLFFKTLLIETNGILPNHSLLIKGFVR